MENIVLGLDTMDVIAEKTGLSLVVLHNQLAEADEEENIVEYYFKDGGWGSMISSNIFAGDHIDEGSLGDPIYLDRDEE